MPDTFETPIPEPTDPLRRGRDRIGAARAELPVMGELHAGCHRAIAAFVARRTSAADFLRHFRRLSGGEVADASLDDALGSIRGLCESYGRSLPTGAAYRVSEEQFRVEVRHAASRLLVGLPAPAGLAHCRSGSSSP